MSNDRPKMHWWAVALALGIAGCDDTLPSTAADQCLRHKLFLECLAAVPAGPTKAEYNDWAEIVSECSSHAYYASLRRAALIKPECRS